MDDERVIREMARDMLASAGYEAVITADGAEAIAKYREARQTGAPFDAVILDLTVPGGMGGEKAIAELKKTDPGIIAIVSSGYSENPVLANYADFGFAAMAAKPNRIHELLKTVQEVLEKKII